MAQDDGTGDDAARCRDHILLRRRRFLGAALAAVGVGGAVEACSQPCLSVVPEPCLSVEPEPCLSVEPEPCLSPPADPPPGPVDPDAGVEGAGGAAREPTTAEGGSDGDFATPPDR